MNIDRDYSFLSPKAPPPDILPSLRIAIAPTPDFTLLSLACFVESLRHAADESDFSRQIYCSWSMLSHNTSGIRASCGFQLTPTGTFGDVSEFDYIVVHGGVLHSSTPVPDELYAYILKAVEGNVPVIGLCTGQFVLAELGLLDERHCAVHFSLEEAMRRRFPKVISITDAPIVRDGPYITCPGGLAAINLAMFLISKHCGDARVHKVLHYFMADRGLDKIVDTLRTSDDLALNCPDRRVVNAVGLMRQQTFNPVGVENLARQVGTTKRELTRLFNKYLGISPGRYWRNMRLSSAHWMLLHSDRSVAQIACECGFTDSSHLIRWFKTRFGRTPSELRRLRGEIGIR